MPFKPIIHLLYLLANGPAKVHAFAFLQNQPREMASMSTSSIDLAHIVAPVTLTTMHTSSHTGTKNAQTGTLDLESHYGGMATSTTHLTVSQTLQPSNDTSPGSQSTVSASSTMNPSSTAPPPSPRPTSGPFPQPPTVVRINVQTLTSNAPVIAMEHTVITTVFVMQDLAEPLKLSTTPSGVI